MWIHFNINNKNNLSTSMRLHIELPILCMWCIDTTPRLCSIVQIHMWIYGSKIASITVRSSSQPHWDWVEGGNVSWTVLSFHFLWVRRINCYCFSLGLPLSKMRIQRTFWCSIWRCDVGNSTSFLARLIKQTCVFGAHTGSNRCS